MELMWRVNVWRPQGTLAEQLLESATKAFTFSFESHAHARFHGKWPYVGSLFTLSLAWLPLVRGSRKTLVLAACTLIGVATWYPLSHVERYLQLLTPWMAAVTAAALVLGFRQGTWLRIPLVALVAVQLWWNSDAMFIRSHAMLNELPLLHGARLFESGFKKDYARREEVAGTYQQLGELLPEGSRLLLHDENGRLGLRHSVVQDKPRYTGLIAYGELHSAAEVYDLLESLGVTHVAWRQSSVEYSTLGADFRFFEFAENATEDSRKVGGFLVSRMPSSRPVPPESDVALYAGCGSYEKGFFRLRELDLFEKTQTKKRGFEPFPSDVAEAKRRLGDVRYLAYDAKCTSGLPYPAPGFVKVATRREEELWVRPWR